MKQLSWTDTMFLRVETPSIPMVLNPVMIYDQSTAPGGEVTFTGILAAIESRLHLAPSFRRKLVGLPFALAAPYWIEDETFDLEYHVRHIALPAPGDWRQLCIQLAQLYSRPLDLSRPPWDMTVIEGLHRIDGVPPGAFAISLKVHHCAIDGLAGVQMITALHDLSPTPTATADPPEKWRGEAGPNPLSLVARTALNGVGQSVRAARAFGGHAPAAVRAVASRVLFLGVGEAGTSLPVPRTRFQGAISAHRVFEARFFEFKQIRQIKRLVPGATVNDVALALVGGALRHYLLEHGELPRESLVAGCPVSLRTPKQAKDGGNMLSVMREPVRTDIADPTERLTAIAASTSQQRVMRSAVAATALLEVAELLPGALLGIASRALTLLPGGGPNLVNVSVTNIPGPRIPMYFCGAEVVRVTGSGPIFTGVGLIHIIGTYSGTFSCSITADREMMPDPQFYAQCLQRSFDELVAAVARAVPGAEKNVGPQKTAPAKGL